MEENDSKMDASPAENTAKSDAGKRKRKLTAKCYMLLLTENLQKTRKSQPTQASKLRQVAHIISLQLTKDNVC